MEKKYNFDKELDESENDSKTTRKTSYEKEQRGPKRYEKSDKTKDEEFKRKRERSRESKNRRQKESHKERHKQNEKELKHRKSFRSRSRSSSDQDSRKRSRSRHGRRDLDPHSSRYHKDRSRSREHKRRSRREHKDDFVDSVDKKTQEILREIEIPKEIRKNRDLVTKYQADQLKKKAEEMTGVKIPTFYNTSNINPLVLAEQQRKRKLLWSKSKDNENYNLKQTLPFPIFPLRRVEEKKEEEEESKKGNVQTSTKLVGEAIVKGQDEKTAEKFRKLMGIKSTGELNDPKSTANIQSMQQKAFDSLDKEYEYARVTTHLNRGKGLGFASHAANLLLDANQRLQFQ